MAGRAFSPVRFFRQAPGDLLREYLAVRGVLDRLAIDWPAGLCPDASAIAAAIADAPPELRCVVDHDLRRMDRLASSTGVAVLLEQAYANDRDWSGEFGRLGSHQAKALWAFLESRDVFEVAVDCSTMDRVARWDSRRVPGYLEADCGDEARRALLKEIRAVYRRQGRGQHCHVDFYRRFDPERLCFHAFPEDFSRSDLVFDDEGRLSTSTRRPASEAIFVYRPQEGVVELHAKGTAAVRTSLFDAFARTVLGLDGMPLAGSSSALDLSRLIDPEYRFQIGPEDPFEGVGVVGLKIALPGATTVHASFAAAPGARADSDVRGAAAMTIRSRPQGDAGVHVVAAKLRFRPRPGGKRPKPLTCELALPSRCTLRDEPAERDAKRCLQRWGIYAATAAL